MLPNLLGTRKGRLAAFFLLYVTEGIPLGFVATAIATQLRRQGVGPAEIGAFVASFYLPWAFKWAFGPFVDVFRSQRWGHRRAWILVTQIMMAATLLALIAVPMPSGLGIFTAILLVHNTFAAIQDVAIDSLAVNTLSEDERGLANGLMFAGASVGQAIGGSGVLFLMAYINFQSSFIFVAAAITLVTGLVVLPMKEAVVESIAQIAGASRWRTAAAEMRVFAVQSFRAFIGTRGAFSGVFFALLPAGAMSLGLALQSNLAVELGMDDDEVALLNLWSSIVAAAAMVLGGWISDKLGRRITLFFYLATMSLPVLYLMFVLQNAGYVMPRTPGGAPMRDLLTTLWIATMAYAVFQGLMYGTRAAIMMDVTNPRVAATQFTAYMAMMNLAISMAASWQGVAIEAWGYPTTLLVDAILGPLCCLLLPFMKRQTSGYTDAFANARARNTAVVLGLLCLSWLLYWPNRALLGSGQPIVNTLFTLVFIASALFLLAGREVLGTQAGLWRVVSLWTAPLLLAMHLRYQLDKIGNPAAHSVAESLMYLVPFLGGVVLIGMSTRNWSGPVELQEKADGADVDATLTSRA
ncbi:MAG: MFS transporter [Ramlibacter sp.]|nr:MFS transporter [Ramlibacter sp.]